MRVRACVPSIRRMSTKAPAVNFSDTRAAFQLCTVSPLVKNARPLVRLGEKVAPSLTSVIIKHSFFSQFCVGEDPATIQSSLARLRKAGIGGILDYAAEADVAADTTSKTASTAGTTTAQGQGGSKAAAGESSAEVLVKPASCTDSAATRAKFSTKAAAQPNPSTDASIPYVIKGTAEAHLDENLRKSMKSLQDSVLAGGYAAVKLTGLAEPELLQHISKMLHDHRRAFRRFNTAQVANPYVEVDITRANFIKMLRGPRISEADANDLFDTIDYMGDGKIDYLEWLDFMAVMRIGGPEAQFAAAHAMHGAGPNHILSLLLPAAEVELSASEQQSLQHVLNRANALAGAARDVGATVMIDAEQTYLQPAIDYVTTNMMRRFNRAEPSKWHAPETAHMFTRSKSVMETKFAGSRKVTFPPISTWPYNTPDALASTRNRSGTGSKVYPVVYNTYQAYLTDAASRLRLDLLRAERESYLFGAKLVRGAYMTTERPLAKKLGYNDPIHKTIEDTHACYHKCADLVLEKVTSQRAELMIASHNENSIVHVTNRMRDLNIDPTDGGVAFGQLLGMCDHISYSLGALNYKVYKYVPYGPVLEVVPYLIRRAEENSDVLGGVGKELRMLSVELGRRFRSPNA